MDPSKKALEEPPLYIDSATEQRILDMINK